MAITVGVEDGSLEAPLEVQDAEVLYLLVAFLVAFERFLFYCLQ